MREEKCEKVKIWNLSLTKWGTKRIHGPWFGLRGLIRTRPGWWVIAWSRTCSLVMECSWSGLFGFKEHGRGQVPWEHVKFSGVLGRNWQGFGSLCNFYIFAMHVSGLNACCIRKKRIFPIVSSIWSWNVLLVAFK